MQDGADVEMDEEDLVGEFTQENNLIFAQSDYLRVYATEISDDMQSKEKMKLRCDFAINDKIIDMIAVPTDQFTSSSFGISQ